MEVETAKANYDSLGRRKPVRDAHIRCEDIGFVRNSALAIVVAPEAGTEAVAAAGVVGFRSHYILPVVLRCSRSLWSADCIHLLGPDILDDGEPLLNSVSARSE